MTLVPDRSRPVEVIYEDEDLLVVNKPADLVCHPTKGDEMSSLVARLRLYLGPEKESHLINRLDRETSGLVLVAKNLQAAREIRRIWEARQVRKEYEALVHGWPDPPVATVELPLGPDEASPVAIKDRVREDGSPAITHFRTLSRFERDGGKFAHLLVQLETGRKHQIRIHLSHLGHPLVGDKLYGPDELFYLALVEGRLDEDMRKQLLLPNQALHAASVELQWRGQSLSFRCPPEPWFLNFLSIPPIQPTS